MLNLTPHRRLHIPNGVAVIAAVLLIGSSYAGINAATNETVAISECESTSIVKNIDNDIASIGKSVKQNSRALKFGMQLFQR